MQHIPSFFKNKRIAVLGAGLEGSSSKHLLTNLGAEVTLLDEGENPNAFENLIQFDLLVRSPGVKLTHNALKDVPKEKITSQTRLFFDLCPSTIIGVTGTKGKGTTASLIYEMLKSDGRDVSLGGNIGTPPLDFLENLTTDSWVILELSSFQLQDLHKSPHIAVMLMMVSEHMDYHADMDEYVDAKRNILRYQTAADFAVLNRDYIATNESDIHTEAHVYYVSRERSSVPEGVYTKDDALWLRKGESEKKVINTGDIALPGKHNLENAGAAIMAADLAGVTREAIHSALKTFKGLPHRLELVKDVAGVKYYDDSFSTTPETAMAAIAAFADPEVLILGGSGKNSDFSELGKVIREAKNIRAVIGIGEEWLRIREQIAQGEGHRVLIEGADSMEKVVLAASKIAQKGDVVLLSPACASFGMFKNYKERGEKFTEEVKKL